MMPSPDFLFDGPDDPHGLTVVLAHGAGAPMDSPFMTAMAHGVAAAGYRVARFEFPYMAKRRAEGTKRPPDPAPVLVDTWWRALQALGGPERLVIGGKSMGGRIASMVAVELASQGVPAAGVICLGYPFHPPGRPDRLRIAHLAGLRTPTLIVQGTRDPLGKVSEVKTYPLAPTVEVHWIEDGDHSFRPRKASGRTEEVAWAEAVAAMTAFLASLG
jgi:predicted alpha/beta-hydrolase family hydrolase